MDHWTFGLVQCRSYTVAAAGTEVMRNVLAAADEASEDRNCCGHHHALDHDLDAQKRGCVRLQACLVLPAAIMGTTMTVRQTLSTSPPVRGVSTTPNMPATDSISMTADATEHGWRWKLPSRRQARRVGMLEEGVACSICRCMPSGAPLFLQSVMESFGGQCSGSCRSTSPV